MVKKVQKKIHNILRRITIMSNWYWFMWPLSHFGTWPRVAKLRSGGKITIKAFRSPDYAHFNEVIMDDVYHVESYENPKRILDVGANVGTFSIFAAKTFPHAEIIAFEPEKINFEILKNNISMSNAKNIIPINAAISTKIGEAELCIDVNPVNSGSHSLYGKGKTQTVKTRILSEFLPADILKLDAEGIEYDIFKETVPDFKYIAMETHQGDNATLFATLDKKYTRTTDGELHFFRHR